MSDLALNIDDGTPGQLHGKRRNETNSRSGNSQGKLHRWGVEIARHRRIKDQLESFYQNPDKRTAVLFINVILWLDPFFFYILEIKDDKKCIVLRPLMTSVVCVLLTIFDVLYVLSYGPRLLKLCSDSRRDAGKLCILLCNILIILPLPQVMLISPLLQRKGSWTILLAELILILQHGLRFLQLMFKWRGAAPNKETFFRWSLMFLFLYITASQLFAGVWYNGAIYKETQCWKEASCRKHRECTNDFFHCENSSKEIKLLDDFCSRNTTKYDFGIFQEAHQSGMLQERKIYYEKLMFFFRWGLQNLSSFGQNIQTVTQVEGNLLAVSIIYTGVVLFFFLVGKMQLCLQADTKEFGKMKQKLQETEDWTPFNKLSGDLQSQVKNNHHQNDVLQKTKGVNIEKIYSDLSPDLRIRMNEELCIDLLKKHIKVEEFGTWGEAAMQDLCDCVKPVFYGERIRLIREGEPIDEMIFVMKGRLWTYTSASRGITPASSGNDQCNRRNEHLKDGDSCGKELVSWVQADPYTSDLPISTKTIQAVTDVEAFVLMAYDLKNIFIKHREAQINAQETNTSKTVPIDQVVNTINTKPAQQ